MKTYYFDRARVTSELPLRAVARERYAFPEGRIGAQGALQVQNLGAAQTLAKNVNDARDAKRFPESAVRAGELYAAALVQEMLRLIVAHYLVGHPDAIARAYGTLEAHLGPDLEGDLMHGVPLATDSVHLKNGDVIELAGTQMQFVQA